jgi:DGQHR domain-containing protein
MKFFFADGWDTVDPAYDFAGDRSDIDRSRQLSDLHAHDVFGTPPYDGMLISRTTIGFGPKTKYSQGQRMRLLREGIREFLRFPCRGFGGDPQDYPIMGDCGAFSYAREEVPPYTAEGMVDFYTTYGFTHGVAPDHIIFASDPRWDDDRKRPNWVTARAEYTLSNAKAFLTICQERHVALTPVGVIQSWSPKSAKRFALKLVEFGYDYIGIGGLCARPTRYVARLVAEVRSAIPAHVRLHIFGFCKPSTLKVFHGLGITSFDSSAPLFMAFKDKTQNYFTADGKNYMAIRVPHRSSQPVNRRIVCGELDDNHIGVLEKQCMTALRAYAAGKTCLEVALKTVSQYEHSLKPALDRTAQYRRTLQDKPWEHCGCSICRDLGVEVIIHRGMNRNNRRGFHNLRVFFQRLKGIRAMATITVPCIKMQQNPQKPIYAFAIEGRDICRIASISRIRRTEDGSLAGYQRPEILEHIAGIQNYLERKEAILPNSIVVAFNRQVEFEESDRTSPGICMGKLTIPLDDMEKAGWIVDGQQRSAALRSLHRDDFPVSVIGFESSGVEDEREQFLLVNNVKPLPKSLFHELLPSIGQAVPLKMKGRQRACEIMERLNTDADSPFCQRIRTITARQYKTANIQDTSVLKMIENSMKNGTLSVSPEGVERAIRILKNYWTAVQERYADAWVLSPRESRLTHGVGIVGMGYLMDTVAQTLSGQWDVVPSAKFLQELKLLGDDLPWKNGVWAFDREHHIPWNELQNASRHIELVANFLIRRYKHFKAPFPDMSTELSVPVTSSQN